MKVSRNIGVVWAIVVFVVIGAVLVLVALLRGGDETDMEDQPTSGAPVERLWSVGSAR